MCWTVDPCGKRGESCIFTLLGVRFAWQASGMVAIGCGASVHARVGNRARSVRFAWQAWGIANCWISRRRACRGEIVAGAGSVLICGCILVVGVSQYAMGV